MSVNNLPSSTPGLLSPQILSALQTIIQDISTLITTQNGGNLNMGPPTDMMTYSNKDNIFAGATTPPPVQKSLDPSPASGPKGSSLYASKDINTPPGGPSGPVGGPSGASGPSGPSGAAGGSDPEYVAMMNKALKDNGAPDDVIQAYNEQYKLLGLSAGGPGANAPTPTDPNAAPAAGTPPPGGMPPLSQKTVVPPGTNTPPADPNAPTPPGGTPTDNAQGHPLGKIVVTDPAKYDAQINAAIQKYGGGQQVDPNIIKGMIWQESKGDPLAVGSLDAQGSKGLLQVTSDNATKKGFPDQFKPEQSIELGVKMYAEALKNNNGDVTLALGEYNQGPGAKSGAAAQTYAQKVQQWAPTFAKGAGSLPGSYKEGQLE